MIREHDRIEELMAVAALGALDGDDVELLARLRADHGPDCPDCAQIETGFGEVSGRLGFSLDPIAVGDRMADEILARAKQEGPSPTDQLAARRGRRGAARWRALVAVAASFALIVGGVVVWDVTRSHQQTVVLAGSGPQQLSVKLTPGQPGVHATGTGFADLSAGQVYELWTIRNQTNTIKVACFTASGGSVTVNADTAVQVNDTMAVTVEPGCQPSKPTTTPIISAEVT